MKTLILMFIMGIGGVTAVMHSWKAFYTGSTGLSEFPEFVAVNLLDDEVMGYFDSRTNRFESRQSWMKNLGQDYDERQTNILQGHAQTFKANVKVAMERFNQSKGVHIAQWMVGCEWDDETEKINGYSQQGYDGEDWISFDLKTGTWIAPKQESLITKHKWDHDKANTAYWTNYLNQECPEWLKKYVNYGRSSLMRKELPSVSLLQKTPSSPVTCHATGFYPDRADLFWTKDGEELHEDVDKGEILPNHDGTFQMRADLKVSTIAPEELEKYDCVFQLSGVEGDVITKLGNRKILTTEGSSGFPFAAVFGGIGGLLVLIACITAVVICVVIPGREYKNISPMSSTSNISSSSAEDPDFKKKISDEQKIMIKNDK